ncbi:MAG: VOC family protein [Candidatus Levybacteria bacterium]|nr:VOC family protein [Candidatus Levybacteria bacterium]
MILGLETILIGSPDAKKLGKFYKDTLKLKVIEEMEFGENNEYGIGFDLKNNVSLYIIDHSKVKGKSVSPDRVMFNLEVDDIEKELKRLKKEKVKIVADIYHVENYGLIATLADPDGNYFQLVKTRE